MSKARIALAVVAWIVAVPLVLTAVVYLQGIRPAPGCRDWAGEYLQEKRILIGTTSLSDRVRVLSDAAKAAAEVGDTAAAKQLASEALRLLPQVRRDWNYGNVIHDAHMVLGRVALRRGDIVTARHELLLAGGTPGSPQLNSFGPNMSLASDLLRAGDRDTVIEYFHECSSFWEMDRSRLRRWEVLVKLHLPPDFGANFLY